MTKDQIPYYLTKEYYVEKLPLYLRQGQEQNLLELFKILIETPYEEFQNLDYYNLNELLSKELKDKEIRLLDKFFENSKDQRTLQYYINNPEGEKYQTKPTLYYKYLVHILSKGKLITKRDWFEFLKQLNLLGGIKFVTNLQNKTVKIRISDNLDVVDGLTRKIFQNILNYNFKISEIVVDHFDKNEINDSTFYVYKFNQYFENNKEKSSYFNIANFWFDGENILLDLLENND